VKILKATPATLQVLSAKHGLMKSLSDVVINVGGIDKFETLYLPVLERFADRVQELPMQKIAFDGLGGALACAVKASTLAVRTCDATIFSPDATAAQRMSDDGNYRWLTYCAALATVYLITVANVDPVHERSDAAPEIYNWSDDVDLINWKPNYQMAWLERPQLVFSRLSPYLSPLFFPGQFAHLSRKLVSDFGSAINPSLTSSASEAPLARIVRQSIERVISDEKASIAGWVIQPGDKAQTAPKQCATDATQSPNESTQAPPDSNGPEEEQVAPLPPPPQTPTQIKAREWLVALGAIASLDPEVTNMPDGRLVLTRKALGLGSTPTATYKLMHEAGFCDAKSEKTITINKAGGEIYRDSVQQRSPA